MEEQELKQAFERLGLPEDTPEEELERRFELLLKRQRSVARSDGHIDDLKEIEADIQAIRLIQRVRRDRDIQQREDERLSKWGRFAGTARSVESFVRLYKVHTIAGILVLAAAIWGVVAFLDHREEQAYLASLPPVEATIMLVGNYMEDEPSERPPSPLEEALVKAVPDWGRVEATVSYMSSNDSGMEFAYMQKTMAELAAIRPDIFLLDEETVAWLGQQDGMRQLDDIVTEYGDAIPEHLLIRLNPQGGDGEHVYGIDISATEFARSLPVMYTSMIVALNGSDDNADKTEQFLRAIIERGEL